MHKSILVLLAVACLGLTGCMGAQQHRDSVRGEDTDKISVGTVQKEIKIGMSGSDVVSVLGSPNMVTTDGQRRETWVYDKITTERVYSNSSTNGGVGSGGIGGGGSGGGVLGFVFGGSSSSGAVSTSQRTLTVIIKFDEKDLVRDFSYRQSSF